jgi:hypothetical protein
LVYPNGCEVSQENNIISMILHSQRGEMSQALDAARRRLAGVTLGTSTMLLGRARAAAQLGYRSEAVDAYNHYLNIRREPAKGSRAEENVNGARAELNKLLAEPQRAANAKE